MNILAVPLILSIWLSALHAKADPGQGNGHGKTHSSVSETAGNSSQSVVGTHGHGQGTGAHQAGQGQRHGKGSIGGHGRGNVSDGGDGGGGGNGVGGLAPRVDVPSSRGGGHGRKEEGGKKDEKGKKEEKEHLGKGKNSFIGKFHPHGNNKQNKTKQGKPKKHKNPKVILWNGQAKEVKGLSADDKPKPIGLPSDIDRLPKYGRPCIHGKHYKPLTPDAVSGGPKEEGFTVQDFKPCLERRRGHKQGPAPDLGSPPVVVPENGTVRAAEEDGTENAEKESTQSRSKRSESYSILPLLWKDPSRGVPYAFHPSLSAQYKSNIKQAINFWQRNTCLRFVEKSSSTGVNEPHILFTRAADGCSTNRLGPNTRAPYSTVIDIGTCESLVGSIAHEIGHAMGLAHSQKRVDRDTSVRLYFQNIATDWREQFERDSYKYFDNWGVPYYYDSLMHYFPYAATTNGLMTICPLDPMMELVMGQREEPAFGDISLMNRIYCQESCFPRSQLKGMQFSGNKSMTISGRTCQNWASQSPTRHKFANLGNHSSCRNPDKWDGGPWCFTTDPQVRMEPCFSSCEDLAAANRAKCQGWCYNGGYHHPRTCACVCPRWTNGSNCEVVNKQALYNAATVGCGKKIDLRSGQKATITSPNYPSNYPFSKACIWWIQSPNNTRVKLSVQDFQVENADPNGCYDYLEIRPSVCAAATEPINQMRFCGNSLAPAGGELSELYSDDNNMVLKFFSDQTEAGKGFKVMVEVAPAFSG